MINIKSQREIALMKEAGHINFLAHEEIKKNIRPNITTGDLNNIVHEFIRNHDAIPSELNYEGFPKSVCLSVNDEVVHGIPDNRKLKNGDILKVDLTVRYKGYESDSARTYIVGNAKSKEDEDLVNDTKGALYAGLSVVKDGVKLSLVGKTIEDYAHNHRLSVVEDLVGHGIGTQMHEDPDVPNFYTNTNVILKEGMTICIEPMLNLGTKEVYVDDNDWTIKTLDGKNSAHFEHTIVVTKDGYEILTGE